MAACLSGQSGLERGHAIRVRATRDLRMTRQTRNGRKALMLMGRHAAELVWSCTSAVFPAVLVLTACSGSQADTQIRPAPADDTVAVQQAVDRGGVVRFDSHTYNLSRTIVIRHSGTVIQGVGPQTLFKYNASATLSHCANDRVFTTPCEINDTAPRRIARAIAIGDQSFISTDDVSDLQSGDWLIVKDTDSVIGDVVTIDWVQVESVSGLEVRVRTPFRTAFTTAREWTPGQSGLGFQRVVSLVENTEFHDFSIAVPDAGPNTLAVGISVFAALHTTIDHVSVHSFRAQPLYSYLSKGVTITNCSARGNSVLSEFAATVDLTLHNDQFSESDAAAFGLDLGTAFFNVTDSHTVLSRNIGAYLLYGVHDGIFTNNQIAWVNSAVNAVGILVEGAQNISISDNYLAGGDGSQSTAIVTRDTLGEFDIPSVNVTISDNLFGGGWGMHY